MKPQKRTMTVEYWTCRKPEHRHRSEQAALNCLAIYKGTAKGKRVFGDAELIEIAKSVGDKIPVAQILKKFDIGCSQFYRAQREFRRRASMGVYPKEFLNYCQKRFDAESGLSPKRMCGFDVFHYAHEVIEGEVDKPEGIDLAEIREIFKSYGPVFGVRIESD